MLLGRVFKMFEVRRQSVTGADHQPTAFSNNPRYSVVIACPKSGAAIRSVTALQIRLRNALSDV
jgi:hypothetical protein